MLLRELTIRTCSESTTSGVMREVVWKGCHPKHFFALPRVKATKAWRYTKHGRDRRLILDVPLRTMSEIIEVLGQWNAAMALRAPAAAPTKSGKKRARSLSAPEYHMLTDGAHDGAHAGQAMLSYWVESRTLSLTVPVARLGSDREWLGGSQLPPRSALDVGWSLITGQWVPAPSVPSKAAVDAHLDIDYGA
jgi:hypothetical protein